MEASPSQEIRVVAALGYLIWIFAIVVLLTNLRNNRFMRVHAIQALGFTVAWVIIFIVFAIITAIQYSEGVRWLLQAAWLILALYYAIRTYLGETFSIPIVSSFTSRFTTQA